MKRWAALGLLWAVFGSAAGTQEVTLEALFQTWASRPLLSADFTLTKSIRSLGRDFRSEGRLVFSAEQGILWRTLRPRASLTVVGPQGYAQQSGQGPIQRVAAGENRTFQKFSQVMQAVFSGDRTLLNQEFHLSFSTEVGAWRLALVPKDPTLFSVLRELRLEGRSLADLESLTLSEPSGDLVRYQFRGLTRLPSLSPEDADAFRL